MPDLITSICMATGCAAPFVGAAWRADRHAIAARWWIVAGLAGVVGATSSPTALTLRQVDGLLTRPSCIATPR